MDVQLREEPITALGALARGLIVTASAEWYDDPSAAQSGPPAT